MPARPAGLVKAGRLPCVETRPFFFFSSRRRHTRLTCVWSSDVCSSDLAAGLLTAVGDAPYTVTKHAAVSRPAAEQVCSRYPSPRLSITGTTARAAYTWAWTLIAHRSEERRVGKEGRSRRAPCQ